MEVSGQTENEVNIVDITATYAKLQSSNSRIKLKLIVKIGSVSVVKRSTDLLVVVHLADVYSKG